MDRTDRWSYLIAFTLGAVVIGGFDYFYTRAGGQWYSAQWVPPPLEGWPWYVPVQMGLAGATILFAWGLLLPKLTAYFGDGHSAPSDAYLAMTMLLTSLAGCFLFLGHPWHGSVFVLFLVFSFGLLVARRNLLAMAAFVLVGFGGGATEWILLSPSVDYWQFHHRELFSRLPAWEPAVYGWIGVVIHGLARPWKQG